MSDSMKSIPLRSLLREPVKVKRLTRSGQSVQVTDNGKPLWVIQPAVQEEEDADRARAIDELLDEALRARVHRSCGCAPGAIQAVRAYADSSLILRLVTGESGAQQAAADYRRLGRPSLFYLPLHALEVENGIRQRAFHERRVLPSGQRARIAHERDAALARLLAWVTRGALKELVMDMDCYGSSPRTVRDAFGEDWCSGYKIPCTSLAPCCWKARFF